MLRRKAPSTLALSKLVSSTSETSKRESQNLAGLVLSKYESQNLAGLVLSKYESQIPAGLVQSKFESQNPKKESFSEAVVGKRELASRKREPHCGTRFVHLRLMMIGRLQRKLPKHSKTEYGTCD